jgi:hypothetical protein
MNYNLNSGYGAAQAAGLPFAGSGKVFIVGDSGTKNLSMLKDLFGADPDGKIRFYSTIQAAIDACTADAGDFIIVLPGHTETVTAAGGLDVDVAGITILGLGNGQARPTINFTTATSADVDIDAANVTIENIIFDLTGVDAVAVGIDVNASDFTLRRCRVVMGDSDGQAVLGLLSDTNIDRVTVDDCEFLGDTIAGPAAAIRLIGGVEHVIRGNRIQGSFSQAPLALVTTAPLRVLIEHNHLQNDVASGTAAIQAVAGATGAVRYNTMHHTTSDLGGWINTPGNLVSFENYGTNAVGETGALDITGAVSVT